MNRFILPLAAAITLSALSIVTALAENTVVKAGDLEITAAWSRATLPGQPVGAGYMTIENKGSVADRLLSATSEASPMTEVHNMMMDGDVMKMAELKEGLEIPAGGKVELKPGGTHIMFKSLDKGFKENDIVKVMLKFEKAGLAEVALPVQAAGSKTPAPANGG